MNGKKTCEIHGSLLELMQVPVSYGLPVRDELFDEARSKLFPHSRMYVLGGCMEGMIGDYSEEFVCSECRKAETKWRKENDRDSLYRKLQELFRTSTPTETEMEASNENPMSFPISQEYSIGTTEHGNPCVVIKSQQIDWEGNPFGQVQETAITISEIEQLVGFCIRCGNDELMRAVRRPIYRMRHGPDHPFAKQ